MRCAMLLFVCLSGCRVELGPPVGNVVSEHAPPSGQVWIYTSMYQSVIDELTPQIAAKLPDVEVVWFQSGSEKIAQKAEAEWATGGTKACLLMTSDPFWYAGLKEKGRLQQHFAPNVLHLDRSLVDADGMWATSRISLMVLAANSERVPQDGRPQTFEELTDPRWSDRFSMGDPLASGTMFTTLSFFRKDHGWPWLRRLRDNGLIASGGNSSVLTRVESGEREVGILLLENLLKAKRKNTPATPIFPTDGAVIVPGPIALTSDCSNPKAARAVYDFLLSDPGQHAIVGGNMYSGMPNIAPPTGAPPLQGLTTRTWTPGFLDEVLADRAQFKQQFSQMMAEGGAQ